MKPIILLITVLNLLQANDYQYCKNSIGLFSMDQTRANTISFACGECSQHGRFAFAESKTTEDLLKNCKAYAKKASSPTKMCLDICLGINGYSLQD